MNVLVVDYTGESTQWLANFCRKELNILHTITPEEKYWSRFLEKNEYDVVLIFESGKRELFSAMAELFHIPDERIIYATDINSWISHKWAVYTFLDENSKLFKAADYYFERHKRKYSVCTVEDISYIGYSTDTVIMLGMQQHGINWSNVDMDIFHMLANNFYDLSGRDYFLDLGANIGTTSIYFKKKVDPSVRILAFEPDPETYKILRANFILNEMPEDSILENYGLADKEVEMVMHRSKVNPGSNSIVVKHEADDISIHLVSLDDYLDRRSFDLRKIKYIWIDTEGFEPQVFWGMEKLIASQSIPIFMEWNPSLYVKNESFDKFVESIVDNFDSYIDINDIKNGNFVMKKTIDLMGMKDSIEQTDIFLIK